MAGVRPSRRGRNRALLTNEYSTPVVSGDDIDWDTGPYSAPPVGRDQWKQPCRVATTATVTISTGLNAGDTIDGVTLVAGDRVLAKDQSTASQNGIYVVSASPARATDMDAAAEVMGALVYVIAGTTNGGKAYKNTNTSLPTIGSTSLTFTEFGAGGSSSFATPAIVLGSSAAAGAASTVIRSDSTIAAFDATSPTTQALGDSAVVGSAAFAARRDHKHAMPTAAVTTSGLTQATARLLGRTTASTGAIEEITVGTGLSLSAGSLTATGGGGGPTDYVSGPSGSGQIIIPGLYGSADIRVAGVNDDEFDTTDTSDPMTGWTTMGTPTTHDINSSRKSHYYLKLNAAAGNTTAGIYKATPSMPFTVTVKIAEYMVHTSQGRVCLFIGESTPGKMAAGGWAGDNNRYGDLTLDLWTNPTTYGSQIVAPFIFSGGARYLRCVVTSSTVVQFQASLDAFSWWNLGASTLNPAFTVATAGLMVNRGSSGQASELFADWIRFT